MKERPTFIRLFNLYCTVSIHAPVKERHCALYSSMYFKSFNSRSCEGATKYIYHYCMNENVSIHAPVKERHGQRPTRRYNSPVSIHAPVKERLKQCQQFLMQAVSIHAPVKERRCKFV